MPRNNWSLFVSIATLLGVPFSLYRLTFRSQGDRSEVYGRFTRVQIEDRARDLFRELCGGSATPAVRPYQFHTFRRDGSKTRHWAADFADPVTDMAGCALWDADNGDLLFVCSPGALMRTRANHPIGRTEAEALSLRWLARLGIAENEEEWSVASRARLQRLAWSIEITNGDRLATVLVGAETGDLIVARSRRISRHAEPGAIRRDRSLRMLAPGN